MEDYSQLLDWLLRLSVWIRWPKIKSWLSPKEFDMPIRDAIRHILSTRAHSYESQLMAKRTAFTEIHELMCTRRLKVIGADSDFKPPVQIKRKECKEIFPHEVVVPRNETAPDGFLFALIDRRDGDEHAPRHYRGLRVRSQQFYKHWPKVNGAAK